jgi:hypothetical protein
VLLGGLLPARAEPPLGINGNAVPLAAFRRAAGSGASS